jgi:hypothetical protein
VQTTKKAAKAAFFKTIGKGILFFFGTILGLAFFVIPGVIIWIWQIADAYNN